MMAAAGNRGGKTAWTQLYEARRQMVEVETRSPGRPPAPIPRRKVGLTLSQGEINELEEWQNRFSALLNRKVSTGETMGILTRICTARYLRIASKSEPVALDELVEKMIG
jgi:hypothetical protein